MGNMEVFEDAVLSGMHLYDARIVKDVSLRLASGRITALIGPNGAGKSTLLKLLAGVLRPRTGEIHLFGQSLRKLTAKQRANLLGYMPQQSQIDVAFTVQDVIEMGFYARKCGADRDEFDRIAERVGMTEFLDRDIRTLSGGERQRALLGKVLAQNARILLLDEPVSGLDLAYQMDILELCQALRRDGHSILITLHDMEHVLRYTDDVYVLVDGSIIDYGEPLQVLTGEPMQRAFRVTVRAFSDPITGVARLSVSRAHLSDLQGSCR